MRILILEDDVEYRTVMFRRKLIGHELTFAETSAEAIAALSNQRFDLIFLDHDLGGMQYVTASDQNTGSEVVRWIMKQIQEDGCIDLWSEAPVIVHSLNIDEALKMQANLQSIGMECHQIPFSALVKRFDDPNFIT